MRGLAHIVLVGTSSLRNVYRALTSMARGEWASAVRQQLEANYDVSRVREDLEYCREPRPGSHEDVECGKRVSGASEAARAVCEALKLRPYEVSAEANAMRPWLEAFEGGRRSAVGSVVLLSTDTGAGQAAAGALRCLLASLGVPVQTRVVQDLGRPEALYQGLTRLASVIKEEAQRLSRQEYCVALNLTGGFKPEGAYALIGGYARAYAAYYIHESFHHTVVIPLAGLLEALERLPRASRRVQGLLYYPLDPGSPGARCLLDLLEPPGLARPYSEGGSWGVLLDPGLVAVAAGAKS